MSRPEAQSYSAMVWRQFRKNRRAIASLYGILALVIVALLADFIANDKPYTVVVDGHRHFPILIDYGVRLGVVSWPDELRDKDYRQWAGGAAWFPPIPYLPRQADLSEEAFSPPSVRHWLGTDQLGRDVASGMVHGTRISLTIGLVVTAIQL